MPTGPEFEAVAQLGPQQHLGRGIAQLEAPAPRCRAFARQFWYYWVVGLSPPIHTRIAAFARCWIPVYVVLYVLPFPLTGFPIDRAPGVTASIQVLLIPWRALVTSIGEWTLAAPVAPHTSSTDNLYNYVATCCLAALAALMAALWPFMARTGEPSDRMLAGARAYAALYLGAQLLAYGWVKLIPTQMPVPGPDRLIIPIGDMSPMGVLWTFMGLSPGYQMLTGLVEVLGGTLLFWRRTRLLGAFLAAQAMAQVAAMNFGYDVPLKLYSTHLLALALFILAPDLRRLLAVLLLASTLPPRPPDAHPIARPRWRWTAWTLKLALLLAITIRGIVVCTEFIYTRGALAPDPPLHGVYRVESFTRDGVADAADAQRWLRVGINKVGPAAIQHADGSGTRYSLKVDETRHSLTFTRHDSREKFLMHYTESSEGTLRLVGVIGTITTEAVLRKQPGAPSPSNFRFRWIQDGFVNH